MGTSSFIPEEDPEIQRLFGALPSGRFWVRNIERVFRSLKHSRGLEGHCVRGMRKILLHATMSVLTYQATVLFRLKVGDVDRMRQIGVKVA